MDNSHGNDILGKVTEDQDFIKKFLSKIPGMNYEIETKQRHAQANF